MKKKKTINYKEANLSSVKIEPPKGRPMLHWAGKKPVEHIKSFPEQLVEVYNPLNENIIEKPSFDNLKDNWNNLLFHGDNKEVLGFLLNNGFRGKIDLIYIDPPFNTGINYVRQVKLKNIIAEKLSGEDYSPIEQLQYFNNWHIDSYLQYLYERIQLANELLSNKGVFFLRIDIHQEHYLRLICNEIFGLDSFENLLVVNRIKKNVTNKGRRTIPNAVDCILVYMKSNESEFYNVLKQLDNTKKGYWHSMDSAGIPGPRKIILEGVTYYPPPGRHFSFTQTQVNDMFLKDKIKVNPKSKKLEYWVEPKESENLDTNWTDIPGYTFQTGYPTENAEKLLERIIKIGTKENDLVLDFFCGSGTTMSISQKMNRRWIGCDINKGAIQTTSKRLQDIISKQGKLFQDKNDIHFTFTTFKINDYDLKVLHTEAIELAIEHLGIQRTKMDSFFEGTRGKKLAKIIDFNHPLSIIDLQLIQDELKKRPDEDRNITVVSLGKELSTDDWIKDYNKKHPVNKIEVIELRTDSKYGKFLIHEPCKAKVEFRRNRNKAVIEIQDFISPSIIERLNANENLFKVKIPDFRSMIDVVLIDKNYNGKVFNIFHSDVPEKKNDYVKGCYEIEIPGDKITIAVKIVDMLGEELLITNDI